ncbi:hypothetical protein M231_00019 [Tremella mesenterica]|uniref:Uncharacterized protein n=1 Tax=Tremella mesenterica TaxID=5217 RepID=A0A4Q1BWC5_TREME|nr:hypothetical protein M231_00019 [Tremella mesenterica]
MRTISIGLWGGLLLASGVLSLSSFDFVEIVKTFADNILAPSNIKVAQSINSTLFAEDVSGTVDVSANFDGRELSTEYLFGLFVNTASDPNDPSPLGSPISYNVTALAVEHNTVATSVKFEFFYPALGVSFPIQIDAWFTINEEGQIEQYDASFRRWAWATDIIIPMLIPHMAQRANVSSSSNSTFILQQYLAHKVCNASAAYCTGSNKQYDSYDDCLDFVTSVPIGQFYRMGEDNLVCRHLHVPMIPLRPAVHCPHIGRTGGDMCIDRNYNETVLESHFPTGFLAPKFVTPENKVEIGDVYAASGSALPSSLELSLSGLDEHSWDPTLYPIALLGLLLFYYVVANVIHRLYFWKDEVFAQLSLEYQKNVVVYTMNTIFTAIALALQLASTPAFAGHYTLWGLRCLRTAGTIISSLYCFELIHRLHMRIPMIIHHFLTIIAISFTVTMFEYTESMSFFISAVIWLFQATTEQFTFIGLLGYRLEWRVRTTSSLLKLASVQSLLTKSASAIALLVFWGLKQRTMYRPIDVVWTALLWFVAIGLLLTQLWGSYVTWMIGHRVLSRHPRLQPGSIHPSSLDIYRNLAKRKPSQSSVSMTLADAPSSFSPTLTSHRSPRREKWHMSNSNSPGQSEQDKKMSFKEALRSSVTDNSPDKSVLPTTERTSLSQPDFSVPRTSWRRESLVYPQPSAVLERTIGEQRVSYPPTQVALDTSEKVRSFLPRKEIQDEEMGMDEEERQTFEVERDLARRQTLDILSPLPISPSSPKDDPDSRPTQSRPMSISSPTKPRYYIPQGAANISTPPTTSPIEKRLTMDSVLSQVAKRQSFPVGPTWRWPIDTTRERENETKRLSERITSQGDKGGLGKVLAELGPKSYMKPIRDESTTNLNEAPLGDKVSTGGVEGNLGSLEREKMERVHDLGEGTRSRRTSSHSRRTASVGTLGTQGTSSAGLGMDDFDRTW